MYDYIMDHIYENDSFDSYVRFPFTYLKNADFLGEPVAPQAVFGTTEGLTQRL